MPKKKRKSKKSHDGKIPLHVLEKRANRLNEVVKRRGGHVKGM